MQHLALAQQILQLEDVAPADLDPEDTYGDLGNNNAGADNDGDVDIDVHDPSGGREHYVDVGLSELRKMRDSVADPKYDGVKTSRNQLLEDESEKEEQDEDKLDESLEVAAPSQKNDAPMSSSASEIEDVLDHHSSLAIQHGAASSHSISAEEIVEAPPLNQTLASSLRDSRTADKLKGKAISRQQAIWDSIVDARIRLQKSVHCTNKLPHPENIAPYVSKPAGRAAAQKFLSEAIQLSDELLELRHTLLSQKDLVLPPRKKRRLDHDADGPDYEALICECTAEVAALDAATHGDMLSIIQKWSAKVQAVAPSALLPSSRVSFKGSVHVKSAVELVEEALQEQDKVIKRTWSRAPRIGDMKPADGEDEGDDEAFDDRDFYQSLLRDIIESKGGKDGINPSDLYLNSQKQKKKKVVDTKASKGRKLRYEPHEKLKHFMVPVPARGAWHEEQIDELFTSLLGRSFDETDGGANDLASAAAEEVQALQDFRVFG